MTAAGEPAVRRIRVRTVVALLVTIGALVAAVIVALRAAGAEDGPALTVGDCVEIQSRTTEYGCGDYRSMFRIVARVQQAGAAVDACRPHTEATRAILDPNVVSPAVVLCLAPTRFNVADAGAVRPGDCVTVGKSVLRLPCGSALLKVVAAELRPGLPVTAPVCRDQPQTRMAHAQQSLAGRATVLCVVDLNINALGGAAVGDCVERNLDSVVPCDDDRAFQRLLSVRTEHGKPLDAPCARVPGALSSAVMTSDTTAFAAVYCLGPIDRSDAGYAVVGECLHVDPTGEHARRIDCADPAADLEVIDRRTGPTPECPVESTGRVILNANVTSGATLCTIDR